MRISPFETVKSGRQRRPLTIVPAVMFGFSAVFCYAMEEGPGSEAESRGQEQVVITIVYDNNAGAKELRAEWGFACVIEGLEKTILFDTGGDGGVLLENMRKLNVDPKDIEVVVLSHVHGDHTGGLEALAEVRAGLPAYMPTGFPAALKERWQSLGTEPKEAAGSEVICRGARTTGTLGKGAIEEHGLCVETTEGWVLITGCAHPGVENLAAEAKKVVGKPLRLVVGGFHMIRHSEAQIKAVIDSLKKLGVKCVAPCHCTGDEARKQFAERYGEDCTLAGVGSVFRLGGGQ